MSSSDNLTLRGLYDPNNFNAMYRRNLQLESVLSNFVHLFNFVCLEKSVKSLEIIFSVLIKSVVRHRHGWRFGLVVTRWLRST